jgi:hypothetical protein
MDRTVTRLNIDHFLVLLKKETDPSMRLTLLRLLREEEEKLAKFKAQAEKKNAEVQSIPASVSDARQSSS